MKIKDYTKDELENMSYDDIAFMILNETKRKMKIIDLFSKVGKYANLSEKEIEDKIADFFEVLTLDKRFIMLDNGAWDLRDRHVQKIVIDDEEEEIALDEIEEEELEEQEQDDMYYDENDTDDTDDDLKDLVIIDEDEEDSL